MTPAPAPSADLPFQHPAQWLARHAREQPEALALACGERRLGYAALAREVARVAAALQRDGTQPQQAVAICAAASAEYIVVFLGALQAGVAVAPLAPSATPQQLAAMVLDAGATHVFVDEAMAAALAPLLPATLRQVHLHQLHAWCADAPAQPDAAVAVQPDWAFNIIYSSGTTGMPKGIVQPHGMRWSHIQRGVGAGYGPGKVTLVATPLYSNTTLVVVWPTLAWGGTLVLMPKFDATGYLQLAQAYRASHTMLVPVQYQRLMDHPEFDRFRLSSFQFKACTSAPFTPELKARVLARWPGELVEYYGMTEGGGTCILHAHLYPHKLHTVGLPAPGHDMRLIDEAGALLPPGATGEVVGRSPAMMSGYANQPELSAQAEWHDAQGLRFIRTGDVGRFDDDGFLVLLDRRKDMVISGGFNVYPSDLEAVLRQHPQVADAAVVGVPSPAWGETPVAYVVARGALAPAALRDWVNARVGKTQRLADVVLTAELPRSAIGKVLKRELRDAWQQRQTAV